MSNCRGISPILLFALAVGAPTTLFAQAVVAPQPRVVFEPHVGVVHDPYDIGRDGNRLGPMVGIRVAAGVGTRARLTGTVAYATAGDVANFSGPSYWIYDNRWIMGVGGLEVTLSPGPTNVFIATEMGVAWRRTVEAGSVGTPTDPAVSDDWSPTELAGLAVGLRQRVSPRLAISGRLQGRVYDIIEGGTRVSPGFVLGLELW